LGFAVNVGILLELQHLISNSFIYICNTKTVFT
jgi:hypothetical protein